MLFKLIPFILCVIALGFVFNAQAQPAPDLTVTVDVGTGEVVDVPLEVTVPAEGEEVGFVISSVKWITLKFKNKEYGPAIAAIIMLLLTIANIMMLCFGKEIRKFFMSWISIATGVGVALAIKLAGLAAGASALDWASALGQGLLIGGAAIGFWETAGKWVFKKFIAKAKAKGVARANGNG